MQKIILSTLSLLFVFVANAQVQLKPTQRDSIFRNIDKSSISDTTAVPIIENPTIFNQNYIYKFRLDSITKTVPLSYNEYVQAYIDIYSKRKDMMGKMMGLGQYYFPIFEKALNAYQVPTEIKYLPIIESAMNPHAISRVGATGMWQFMFGTAKAYGLNMDNFVDERKDPIQASYAAAAYFKDAYEELGDWLLAIAAYNCGKGNVNRAIAKAGSRDFWEIRSFLPKETRDYVPAFIAAVYVMNYGKTHDIALKPSALNFNIDTVQVNKYISLAEVAVAINSDESTLFVLNPSYKKKIVNGTEESPKRIILPAVDHHKYEQLYDVLNQDALVDRKVILASTDDVRELRKKNNATSKSSSSAAIHKVKAGQNLSVIANLYKIEVQDLKVWNNLKSNTLIPGQQLKVRQQKLAPKTSTNKTPNMIAYTVKRGDTLSSIAEKFDGATVASIKKANNLTKAVLQPGMVLKISKG